jgi:hypothetical protein
VDKALIPTEKTPSESFSATTALNISLMRFLQSLSKHMLYKNKLSYICKSVSLENLKLFLISDYNTCSTLTTEDNGKDTQKGSF